MTNVDSILNRDITLSTKVCIIIVKVMIFSVVMYRCELDIRLSTKELMLLNCGAGEDLESSLDCKVIKPVNPKGNQP